LRPKIAELQAAADKEKPKAQFDLGQLCEFGDCVAQDYGCATDLYEKAARQGNIEAAYRLSPIYATGGSDNLPSNLAEAEAWADLAARGNGVWRGCDFKKLLDQVTTPGEQADGEKRCERYQIGVDAASASSREAAGPNKDGCTPRNQIRRRSPAARRLCPAQN
jgi:TPR repeat protein